MMTNQTPVENLLALLRTQGPTIKLRTAAEIEALCDRVRPVLAELSPAELSKEALERLRGLSMGDSPGLLFQVAAGLPVLPELARRLGATPDGLRTIAGLLLELAALERGFLLIYEGADNALLTGLSTGQAQVNAILQAAEARAGDPQVPAEVRAQIGVSAPVLAQFAGFSASAAADEAPAAGADGLDESQAVATFVEAVRAGRVAGASLAAGAAPSATAPDAPDAATAGEKRRRAPRKSAR